MMRKFLALSAFLTLSACWDGEEGAAPLFNLSSVTIEQRLGDINCSCGASSGYYVRNTGSKRVSAKVEITSDLGGAPKEVVTKTYSVGANGKQFLGCSRSKGPSDTAGSLGCSRIHGYALKSSQQAWMMPKLHFAILRESDPVAAPIRVSAEEAESLPNCRFECRDPLGGNGLCTNLPAGQLDLAGDVVWLGQALIAAGESGQPVAKSDIMARFDVADDPCDRSDTGVAEGKVINTGAACRLQAELDTPRGRSGASIVMGERISGALAVDEGAYAVRFDTPGERLILQFSDDLTQQTLGGEIHRLSADGEGVIATTPAGCLSLAAQ